jgi:hypothetical protein
MTIMRRSHLLEATALIFNELACANNSIPFLAT